MPSASVTGRTGVLYNSTSLVAATSAMNRVAEIQDITLTLTRKTIDVTNHDSSGFMEILHGIADWKVSGKVNYISTGLGQKTFASQIFAASPLPVRISVAATTSKTAHLWVGTGKITKFEMSHPTDKQSIASIEVVGHGAITRTS